LPKRGELMAQNDKYVELVWSGKYEGVRVRGIWKAFIKPSPYSVFGGEGITSPADVMRCR